MTTSWAGWRSLQVPCTQTRLAPLSSRCPAADRGVRHAQSRAGAYARATSTGAMNIATANVAENVTRSAMKNVIASAKNNMTARVNTGATGLAGDKHRSPDPNPGTLDAGLG